MAGIGHSTDHPSSWNSQSQFNMGRAMMHDLSKPITNISGNLGKRALFGSGASGAVATPSFSDVANLSASGFNSRPGSSQHNGEMLSSTASGPHGRSPFAATSAETNSDNISSFFNVMGFNGSQSGPTRNFSEPSLFPSLSNNSRVVGSDIPTARVGSAVPNSSKPITDARNIGNLFSSPLASDSAPPSSSRGIKLDPSDFPPILTSLGRGNSSSVAGAFSSSSQTPLRNYVSVMSKGAATTEPPLTTPNQSSQNPPEFSKQDFPALPGQHSSPTATSSVPSSSAISSLQRLGSFNPSTSHVPGSIGGGSNRLLTQSAATMLSLPSGAFGTSSNGSGLPPGMQVLPNHLVTNIPKNMIGDQFGMLGLLKLIRVGDYDTTLNMLAPGVDLSSLHSNWQSSGELHTTFVSPCHDSCIGRPQDMDYAVPPEYLIRHLITDRLPDPPMEELTDETLFWLFYNCCREEVQLAVARELYRREWRFHRKEQIWLTRSMPSSFTTDSSSEQGEYCFWDPMKAQKLKHQMTILYADLDDAPNTFNVSSNTLNAFVTTALNPGTHHQQQLSTYQHQQSGYAQSMVSRQPQQQSSSQLLLGGANSSQSPSAAALAGLLSTRQHQQVSPTATNYHNSSNQLARSSGVPLFGVRPSQSAGGNNSSKDVNATSESINSTADKEHLQSTFEPTTQSSSS